MIKEVPKAAPGTGRLHLFYGIKIIPGLLQRLHFGDSSYDLYTAFQFLVAAEIPSIFSIKLMGNTDISHAQSSVIFRVRQRKLCVDGLQSGFRRVVLPTMLLKPFVSYFGRSMEPKGCFERCLSFSAVCEFQLAHEIYSFSQWHFLSLFFVRLYEGGGVEQDIAALDIYRHILKAQLFGECFYVSCLDLFLPADVDVAND